MKGSASAHHSSAQGMDVADKDILLPKFVRFLATIPNRQAKEYGRCEVTSMRAPQLPSSRRAIMEQCSHRMHPLCILTFSKAQYILVFA